VIRSPSLPMPHPSDCHEAIKTYPTSIEADLARLALEGAGIPSVVVGIGVGMEGGDAGVQLLVPDDRVEAALTVLGSA
jgi:hypothetical protein